MITHSLGEWGVWVYPLLITFTDYLHNASSIYEFFFIIISLPVSVFTASEASFDSFSHITFTSIVLVTLRDVS